MIPLADKSVNCCVTSPPYWGLRDYGTAKWEGGSPGCEHKKPNVRNRADDFRERGKRNGYNPGSNFANYGERNATASDFEQTCSLCGAVRVDKQLGLERTPEEYIAGMLEVFREVKRVLRDDGTLWLNMGDSYASDSKGSGPSEKQLSNNGSRYAPIKLNHGLKPKDLVGIPWMLAFALRADGWYLRSDIIWAKPNPMPESVTDRPTKAHEYIFLLSKSERYYYDADAIKEEAEYREDARPFGDAGGNRHGDEERIYQPKSWRGSSFTDERDLAIRPNTGRKPRTSVPRGGFNGKTNGLEGREAFRAFKEYRNKRTVWSVTTNPFPEAHFATFPEELIKPCILAGCPAGGTVLDPFAGSGTTVLVARELQCKGIGLELNPAYLEIAKRRLAQEVMSFG